MKNWKPSYWTPELQQAWDKNDRIHTLALALKKEQTNGDQLLLASISVFAFYPEANKRLLGN